MKPIAKDSPPVRRIQSAKEKVKGLEAEIYG